MSYRTDRRLAKLEAQAAQAAASAPPSAEDLDRRWREAVYALVCHGMAEEYAWPVLEELQSGTPSESQSALTKHVAGLAWEAAYGADSPSVPRPPLAVPREYCALLVAAPRADADLLFLGLRCTTCRMAAPYYQERARGRAWGERVHPCFATCQHCGSALAWSHGWRGPASRRRHFDPDSACKLGSRPVPRAGESGPPAHRAPAEGGRGDVLRGLEGVWRPVRREHRDVHFASLGDPAGYIIADRQRLSVMVLSERYADTDQLGLVLIDGVARGAGEP
jgi:hypothetical protein